MPTYQIGDAAGGNAGKPVPRPLTCEGCGAALGAVAAVQQHAHLTAARIAAVFPAARPHVDRHERECQAK